MSEERHYLELGAGHGEAFDAVDHPRHYQSNTGLEVIEAIKAFVGDYPSYCAGNILKYVCRYRHKNGLEDLKKARWYLNELIYHIEKESN